MVIESAEPPLEPLRFRPVFKDYVWGGRNLERVLGRPLPAGRVAESWEISDHPNGETTVAAGAHQGVSLRELLSTYGTRLVGTRNQGAVERQRFPLLVKLLDANDWLSVQVHPDDEPGDEKAGRRQDLGKTEMWVILDAEPNAEIILGFERPTELDELAAGIENERLESLLHRVPARRGDVFHVPAGTPHAIGPGLVLAEIQQTSDVTYRMYDWNRTGVDGRERPLHRRRALEAVDFSAIRPGAVRPLELAGEPYRQDLLVECPYFRTERLCLAEASFAGDCDGTTFEIWGLLSGRVALTWSGGDLELTPVSWVLLPAQLGRFELAASEPAELLRVFTPEP